MSAKTTPTRRKTHRHPYAGRLLHGTLLLVLACALLPTSAAFAQAMRAHLVRGQAEYLQYCASCHGDRGDGAGELAPDLSLRPTDLTRLGQRYGMPLPRQKLLAFVDGRRPLVSHGTREMPVWGERLWEDLPSRTPEIRKRGTILVILDYIETLQVPRGQVPAERH